MQSSPSSKEAPPQVSIVVPLVQILTCTLQTLVPEGVSFIKLRTEIK